MLFTDTFVYVHEPKTGGTFVKEALYRVHLPGEEKPRPPTHAPILPETCTEGAIGSLLPRVVRQLKKTINARGVPSKHAEENHSYHTRYGTLTFWEDGACGRNKHGGCSNIPDEHCGKPILATVRNPYDLYVSEYEFGWWKKPWYEKDYEQLRARRIFSSRFPNLTFEEYVHFINELRFVGPETRNEFPGPDSTAPIGIGPYSERFAYFYCRKPHEIVRKLNGDSHPKDYIYNELDREYLLEVHFIETDRLNEGLYKFLLDRGYQEADVRFIRRLKKIRPQPPSEGSVRDNSQRWENYYTPELKQLVCERERMLFSLFPQFDV